MNKRRRFKVKRRRRIAWLIDIWFQPWRYGKAASNNAGLKLLAMGVSLQRVFDEGLTALKASREKR